VSPSSRSLGCSIYSHSLITMPLRLSAQRAESFPRRMMAVVFGIFSYIIPNAEMEEKELVIQDADVQGLLSF